jgi:hypothetical protein
MADEHVRGEVPVYVHGEEAVSHVLERLNELHDSSQHLEVPSADALKVIIATVFWASLERDEARPVKPRICYSSEFDTSDYVFERPIPLTVRDVARLAPVLPDHGALGVRSGSGGLEIWGINRVTGAAFVADGVAPGVLFLRWMYPIVILRGHEVQRLAMSARKLNLLPMVRSRAEKDPARGNRQARNALLSVAREIAALGHGGAILIVPDTQLGVASSAWRSELDLDDLSTKAGPIDETFMKLRDLHRRALDEEERLNEERRSSQRWTGRGFDYATSLGNSLDDVTKGLARLSGIDGAIVLDPDLRVLGFGVKIRSKADGLLSTRVVRPFVGFAPHDVPLSGVGGTRHQSAIKFVYAVPGAASIVVSQDGPVSVVGRESHDGPVTVMKHAELVRAG